VLLQTQRIAAGEAGQLPNSVTEGPICSRWSFDTVSGQALKSKSKDKKEVAIHAPSDVAAQGQAVELNHQQQPSLLEELILSDKKEQTVVFIQKTALDFFKTLFRVIISPNAP